MPPLGIPRILGVSISDLPVQLPGRVSDHETLVRLDANGDGFLLLSELQKGFVRNASAGAVTRLFLAQLKPDQTLWLATLDRNAVAKLLAALSPNDFHHFLTQEISRWPNTSQGLIEAISTAVPKGLLGQRLRNSFKQFQPPQQLQLLLATESRWHKIFLSSLCTDPTDMRDLAYLMIRLPHVDANGQFGAMLFSQLREKCSDQLIEYMDRNLYFANGQKSYRDYLVEARHLAKDIVRTKLTFTYIPNPQLAAAAIQKLQLTSEILHGDFRGSVRTSIRGISHNPGCTMIYHISQGQYYGAVIPGTIAPILQPLPSADTPEVAACKQQIVTAPDPRPFFAQLGEHYYKTGDYGAALKAFERAFDKVGELDPAPEFIGRAQYFLGKTLQRLPKDRHPDENLEIESLTGAIQWWKNQIDVDILKKELGTNEQPYFQRHPDEEAMFQETFCYLRDRATNPSLYPASMLFDILGRDFMNSPTIQQLLKTPCDL